MSNFNFIVLFVLSIVRRKYLVNIIRKRRIRIVTYKLIGYSVGLLCVFLILSENREGSYAVIISISHIVFFKQNRLIISEVLRIKFYRMNTTVIRLDIPTDKLCRVFLNVRSGYSLSSFIYILRFGYSCVRTVSPVSAVCVEFYSECRSFNYLLVLILRENDKCLNTVDLVDRIYFSKSRCCIISESLVEIYLVNIVTFVFDIPT